MFQSACLAFCFLHHKTALAKIGTFRLKTTIHTHILSLYLPLVALFDIEPRTTDQTLSRLASLAALHYCLTQRSGTGKTDQNDWMIGCSTQVSTTMQREHISLLCVRRGTSQPVYPPPPFSPLTAPPSVDLRPLHFSCHPVPCTLNPCNSINIV